MRKGCPFVDVHPFGLNNSTCGLHSKSRQELGTALQRRGVTQIWQLIQHPTFGWAKILYESQF